MPRGAWRPSARLRADPPCPGIFHLKAGAVGGAASAGWGAQPGPRPRREAGLCWPGTRFQAVNLSSPDYLVGKSGEKHFYKSSPLTLRETHEESQTENSRPRFGCIDGAPPRRRLWGAVSRSRSHHFHSKHTRSTGPAGAGHRLRAPAGVDVEAGPARSGHGQFSPAENQPPGLTVLSAV